MIATQDFVETSEGIVESEVLNQIPVPHPLTLHFDSAIMERRFRSYVLLKRLQLVRFTLPCLLIAVVLLGVSYDIVFVESNRTVYYNRILRYGICVPMLVLLWISTYRKQFYRAHSQLINTITALALGGVNIALAVIGGNPDHGPQMLYFFVVYNFFHLRFLYASFTCWVLHVAFIIAVRFGTNSSKLGLSAGYMTICNLALMSACWFTEYWLRLDFARHNQLKMEEQRTNDLLQTLLPDRISKKLRNLGFGDNLVAEELDNVSVLFSDIVGFTSYSASITARELVNFLNTVYSCIDHLIEIHEVLKVETIGDAYFVASGVLEPRADHAELLANMAFDMIYILAQFKCKNDFKLQMRIGMHCGRVIAGVVGLKVPRYHLFGPVVTKASLMESTGVPSKIQVSDLIYNLLKEKPDLYVLEERTDEDTDGKRKDMKTYFLSSAEPGVAFVEKDKEDPEPEDEDELEMPDIHEYNVTVENEEGEMAGSGHRKPVDVDDNKQIELSFSQNPLHDSGILPRYHSALEEENKREEGGVTTQPVGAAAAESSGKSGGRKLKLKSRTGSGAVRVHKNEV